MLEKQFFLNFNIHFLGDLQTLSQDNRFFTNFIRMRNIFSFKTGFYSFHYNHKMQNSFLILKIFLFFLWHFGDVFKIDFGNSYSNLGVESLCLTRLCSAKMRLVW